jgi:hypothetical protein
MALRKAQVSAEFLFILAMSLVVILVISVLAQQQMSSVQKQKDSQDTQNSLLDLSAAAKQVYSQGQGSKQLVYIHLPESYEANRSVIGNRSIQMRSAGTDYVALENFNVHGFLPGTPGTHWVWVVSEGDRVRIGDALMDFDKNRIFVVMSSNSTASISFSVTNIWSSHIDITTSTSWPNTDVGMSGVPASLSMDANGTQTITLQFASSANSSGSYLGQIELMAVDGGSLGETAEIPITVVIIPSGQQLYSTKDIQGPIIIDMYQAPTPATKNQPLTIYVNATDALTGNHTVSGCKIDADNTNNWQTMVPADGAYDQVAELSRFNYTSGFSLGPHTVRAKCTDMLNNTGPTAYYYFNVSEADVLGPILIMMNHTADPTTMSDMILGGTATDAYTGVSNVAGCNVKVGNNGTWNAATAVNGTWNTSVTQDFTYDFGYLPVGLYNVYYQCTDSLGNVGGIFNDSFGIIDVDLMVVLDVSGSMADNVTNVANPTVVSASGTGWSTVKNITIWYKNGDTANLTTDLEATKANCIAFYNATINNVQVATGNTTSQSYVKLNATINLTSFSAPITLVLKVKTNGTSQCNAQNQNLSLQQAPSKMSAAQNGADTFINISGNQIQAGLVSFTTTATTRTQLAVMGPSNQTALINAINALGPTSSTCIQCGLMNACNELVSSRARPTATKVVVLLTDGMANYCTGSNSCTQGSTECMGCDVEGAAACRADNVTVYTIGFGSDVDSTELTNIAYITNGEYYFAPNVATLTDIFQSIGRH